jgi:hypothetical protein
VWHLAGGSLTEAGRITQPAPAPAATAGPVAEPGSAVEGAVGVVSPLAPQIERALVVGDKLYTVSEGGILQSDLSTLAQETWMASS